ncbi:MAG: NADP-specific glutamate dehydrogenase [Lentisphaeria bacterium]|nr:NADP-specific glutamate dehydrogenase [Lentisphaeria bacterium]
MNAYAQRVFDDLKTKVPWEKEFLQSVEEVFNTLGSVLDENPQYEANRVLERMVIPDRAIAFQVPWLDKDNKIQINTGYRVQFNDALGPYKGGLRFHPSVTLSVMKFLAFEQTFKDSLTTLPMGGAKGGSDFNPKGKTDVEVMNFCKSFIRELHHHIGPDVDVPAGDIGVGGREIGYLFGEYKRLTHRYCGVLTGKGIGWGGSLIRPEATGYGAIYFVQEMLARRNDSIAGKTVVISGYGNVAWGVAKKASELGARVVTISGSKGYIHCEGGLTGEMIAYMLEVREKGLDLSVFTDKFPGCKFFPGRKPWEVKADIAMPCATQNEVNGEDAAKLVANKVILVAEGSNMGCLPEAAECFQRNGVMFAPGKAVNAGGVATSCLEMSQNAGHCNWTSSEVDHRLHDIMVHIHAACVENGARKDGSVDYIAGANIAGFKRVADAMVAQGI